MSLDRYNQKRDFKKTPEPAGEPVTHKGALHFVIQKHAASRLHYDFRLELHGVLLSWAVPKGPSLNPADKRLAVHVEDHPVQYGGFEGIIPQGEYGGGAVVVWDHGHWYPEGDPEAGYQRGNLKFRLDGEKCQGSFALVRMHGPRSADGKNWLLLKHADQHASDDGERLVRDHPESVQTGRTVEDVARHPLPPPTARTTPAKKATSKKTTSKKTTKRASKALPADDPAPTARATPRARLASSPLPDKIDPELATLVESVPPGPQWLHEVKYDGYRLIARIEGERVVLRTRGGEDWTTKFPWLVDALRARLDIDHAILDGELVHLGADGVTHFGELQRALSLGRHASLVYFVFDALHLQGLDLRDLPLEQRKQALFDLLPAEREPGRIRVSEHILGQGAALFTSACKLGLEGVISKRRDAPYRSGRHRDWLKIKCGKRQEVVVGGFTAARSGTRGIGALLLGIYDERGAFIYCGKVGSGFDHPGAAALRTRLDALTTARSPFSKPPPDLARTTFVRPELVVEISFTDWTLDARMRHPVFAGLREDRPASAIRREQAIPTATATAPINNKKPRNPEIEILGVQISHPDRVLYPTDGITKRDIAEYYAATAAWMMPWTAHRPISVVRCPDNIDKPCFFQKHIQHQLPPGIATIDLDAGDAPFIYVDQPQGLVGLTQVGALEIHLWGVTVERPEQPDRIIIDLDPDAQVPWTRVKDTAAAVRTRLEDLGLRSFVKTTGGKGLHVVVPLTPGRQDWDTVKAFSRAIAMEFARAAPDLFTATATKARRTGKIYIDYLRNYRGSTSVAPYSTRARPGAPVSVPLRWDELPALASSYQYTIKNLPARLSTLKADPWKDLPGTKQFLKAAVLRAVLKR